MSITITRARYSKRPVFYANGREVDVAQVAQSLRVSETNCRLMLGELADTNMQVTSFYSAYRALSTKTAHERRSLQ